MKKTLIALAALAATGAFAQVTVYGRLDAGYANTTNNTTTTAGGSVDTKANGVQSHNSVSSMWGLKGTEDLGGGMNAFFQLEQDIYTANGSTGTTGGNGGLQSGTAGGASGIATFDRVSLIGVNGGFGSIAFGRDYNAVFKVIGATDVNNLSRISTVNLSANIGGSTIPNLVMYSTPDFGGFKVNVNYGNQDTSVGTTTTQAKVTAITGVYANGPLYVGLGMGNTTATTNAGDAKTDGTVVGASYDFGKFKLVGNYITSKATTLAGFATTSTETNIGGVVPMGKMTFVAQIGRNSMTDDGVASTSGTDWVLGMDYNLSARTALFVKTGIYGNSSGTNAAGDAGFSAKSTSSAIGIKTTF